MLRARVPARQLNAALRTAEGERLGRFGLGEADGRYHRWEWLDGSWPRQAFYMHPDVHEPAPSAALSRQYAMPGRLETVDLDAMAGLVRRVDAAFQVFRADDPDRDLATLLVAAGALHWLEIDAGGALELAPTWLGFRPFDGALPRLRYSRCVVQPLECSESVKRVPSTLEFALSNGSSWLLDEMPRAWSGRL